MKQSIFEIRSNTRLTDSVYKMVLVGDTSDITNCGQFVNIQLDGLFLRRPISVCDYDETTLTLIYKVVGKGTKKMAAMTEGDELDVLVDGPFIQAQKSLELKFCGSRNQRLIDVPASLKCGSVVLYQPEE